jgi:hypothetical protein
MTQLNHRDAVAPASVRTAPPAPATDRALTRMVLVLAALSSAAAATGFLMGGGEGRRVVETIRGVPVTLYGDGLYELDTWLVGVGSRGQDLVILLVEVPALLLALRWHRSGHPLAGPVLAGVLAFFTYVYVSLTFGNAQNQLFTVYVAAAALAGFALVRVAAGLDTRTVAARMPARPTPRTLQVYLVAVAAALTLAWLPEMLAGAVTGEVADTLGPYTSQMTHALDLGVVVPLALVAAVQLHRRRAAGAVLALVLLVLNVCIGVLLMAQGVAQLVGEVPLTVGEIVAKMLTFAALTLVAGGLLVRTARAARRTSGPAPLVPMTPERNGP